jgi:hypothetical protein
MGPILHEERAKLLDLLAGAHDCGVARDQSRIRKQQPRYGYLQAPPNHRAVIDPASRPPLSDRGGFAAAPAWDPRVPERPCSLGSRRTVGERVARLALRRS